MDDGRTAALFAAMLVLVASCDGRGMDTTSDAGPSPDGGALPEGVTYHGDVRPLIEKHCLQCHHEGGGAPFPLDNWQDVEIRAFRIVDAVASGLMPPAQTDPECRQFVPQRWVPAEERDVFLQWEEDGYQEGLPVQYEPPESLPSAPPQDDLGPPDLVIPLVSPYTPSFTAERDDFAWLELDHVFEETTHVVASRIVPGLEGAVHHASVHMTDSTGEKLIDQSDPDLSNFQAILAGYFPGMNDIVLPEGAAFVVPAGAHVWMEAHYHATESVDTESPPADTTELHLWTLPAGTTLQERADVEVRINPDLDIAAGDEWSVQSGEFLLTEEPMRIAYVAPHMHYRGVAARMEIIRPDGSRDCVIDTPNYDFDWQLFHRLPAGGEVELSGGETAELTCIYDNSQENQPYSGGTQLRTTDLVYGTGSLDEMCNFNLINLYPLN